MEYHTNTDEGLRGALMELYQTRKDETCMVDYHMGNITLSTDNIYLFDLEFIEIMCEDFKDNSVNFSLRFKDKE
jgi:hypothetical protein